MGDYDWLRGLRSEGGGFLSGRGRFVCARKEHPASLRIILLRIGCVDMLCVPRIIVINPAQLRDTQRHLECRDSQVEGIDLSKVVKRLYLYMGISEGRGGRGERGEGRGEREERYTSSWPRFFFSSRKSLKYNSTCVRNKAISELASVVAAAAAALVVVVGVVVVGSWRAPVLAKAASSSIIFSAFA